MSTWHSFIAILVSWCCLTNNHMLSDLKQQKFIFSRSWRLEYWNLVVCSAMLLLKALGEILPCLSPVFGGCQQFLGQSLKFTGLQLYHSNFCLFLFMWLSSLCVCLCPKFSLLCTHDNPRHLNLITSAKTLLLPNKVTLMGTRNCDFNISFLGKQIKTVLLLSFLSFCLSLSFLPYFLPPSLPPSLLHTN